MIEEAALDPELAIVDPHHHLWERPDSVYLLDELAEDTASHNVTGTVFVECRSAYRTSGPQKHRPVGETAWVRGLAADGLVQGIVGFADLTLGSEVQDVLHAHIEAGGGRFRGVRHTTTWDADERVRARHSSTSPGLLGMPEFGDGLAAVGRLGLSFDAWLYFPQLPELVALARAHPDVAIVLDHLGGPVGIGPYQSHREEALATWRSSMREVAGCANVVLKLGGIGMPLFGMPWHRRSDGASSEAVAAAWGSEIRRCIDWFGPDRCLFESNFPVDRQSFSYSVCWNAFLRMAAGFDQRERRALFHDTAQRVYRLDQQELN